MNFLENLLKKLNLYDKQELFFYDDKSWENLFDDWEVRIFNIIKPTAFYKILNSDSANSPIILFFENHIFKLGLMDKIVAVNLCNPCYSYFCGI